MVEAPQPGPAQTTSDEFLLNVGPQHPATHGVLRVEVTMDGEVVKDIVPHIGYVHRGPQLIVYTISWVRYTSPAVVRYGSSFLIFGKSTMPSVSSHAAERRLGSPESWPRRAARICSTAAPSNPGIARSTVRDAVLTLIRPRRTGSAEVVVASSNPGRYPRIAAVVEAKGLATIFADLPSGEGMRIFAPTRSSTETIGNRAGDERSSGRLAAESGVSLPA